MIYSMTVKLYFQGENPDWVLGDFFLPLELSNM